MVSSLRCKEGEKTRKLSLFDPTNRSDARNFRFIYQRSYSYSGHTKLEGGSQTGGTVQQALKKTGSFSNRTPPLTIGDGDPWRFDSKGCKKRNPPRQRIKSEQLELRVSLSFCSICSNLDCFGLFKQSCPRLACMLHYRRCTEEKNKGKYKIHGLPSSSPAVKITKT